MNSVEYGPFREETMLTAGLDYYKPTMSQLEYEKHPDAEVTFTFKNRSKNPLAEYVEAEDLQARLDTIRERGWGDEEIDYLRSVTNAYDERMFTDDFLNHLQTNKLPAVEVTFDTERNDLAVQTTGEWSLVTFWETIVMSEANEAYFEGMVRANGLDLGAIYDEGDRRLSEKISYLQEHPDVTLADFGTRRRFSLRWQKHVVERLQAECPDNLVGTSNVALANTLGLKPIGTFAHELPMVYAGIADATDQDIRASHGQMLDDWDERYGNELSIALSDTFGTEFFLEDFGVERAVKNKGTRQDSGDPIAYGDRVIDYYQTNDIDPLTKTVVFSDGLSIPNKVESIRQTFSGRIGFLFGVGTDLTNDLGLEPVNNVMKATHVRMPNGEEADLVKLSDDAGKHTGPEAKVAEYKEIFNGNLVTA